MLALCGAHIFFKSIHEAFYSPFWRWCGWRDLSSFNEVLFFGTLYFFLSGNFADKSVLNISVLIYLTISDIFLTDFNSVYKLNYDFGSKLFNADVLADDFGEISRIVLALMIGFNFCLYFVNWCFEFCLFFFVFRLEILIKAVFLEKSYTDEIGMICEDNYEEVSNLKRELFRFSLTNSQNRK